MITLCDEDPACVGFHIYQTSLGDCSFGCAQLCSTLSTQSDSNYEVYLTSPYAASSDAQQGCANLYCSGDVTSLPSNVQVSVGSGTRRFYPTLQHCESIWQSLCSAGSTLSSGVACRSSSQMSLPFVQNLNVDCVGIQQETITLSTGLTGVSLDIAFTAAVDKDRFLNTSLGSMAMSGPLECITYWLEETNLTKMSLIVGTSWTSILHTRLGSHTSQSGNFEEAKAFCLADTLCTGLHCPSMSTNGQHDLCYVVHGTTTSTSVGSTSYLRDSSGMKDPQFTNFENPLFENLFDLMTKTVRLIFRDLIQDLLPSVSQNILRDSINRLISTESRPECPRYVYFDSSFHIAESRVLSSDSVRFVSLSSLSVCVCSFLVTESLNPSVHFFFFLCH